MPPVSPAQCVRNRRFRDAVLKSKLTMRCAALRIPGFDLADNYLCQSVMGGTVSQCVACLCQTVGIVRINRPKPKMPTPLIGYAVDQIDALAIVSHARGHVTNMSNNHPLGDDRPRHFPRKSMGVVTAVIDAWTTVTLSTRGARPHPTRIGLVDMRPEVRDRLLVHRSHSFGVAPAWHSTTGAYLCSRTVSVTRSRRRRHRNYTSLGALEAAISTQRSHKP